MADGGRPRAYEATLLGQVEVCRSMREVSKEMRVDVARACYEAICCGDQAYSIPGVLGRLYHINDPVRVYVFQGNFDVFLGQKLVTGYKLTDISAIVSLRGSGGMFVLIGQCVPANRRIATVLDLHSDEEASSLVYEYMTALEKSQLSGNPSPPELPPPQPIGRATHRPSPGPESPNSYGQVSSEQHPRYATTTGQPISGEIDEQYYEGTDPLPPAESYDNPPKVPDRNVNPAGLLSMMKAPPLPPRPARPPPPMDLGPELYSDYVVDDWLSCEEETHYEDEEKYYLTLGINVKEAEEIYMTVSPPGDEEQEEEEDKTPRQQELSKEQRKEEEEQEEKQPEKETTLEEDISSFLRDEFKFKNTIWRIRDASNFLTREVQVFLKGTETLADIHNNMYEEISNGYKSCARVAEVFISRKDQLERYKYYLSNSPKINRLIEAQSEVVNQMFPKLQEDVRSSWKRLNFYYRSLNKMLAIAPDEEKKTVMEAVEMLRELNRQGDSCILIEAVEGASFELSDQGPLILHSFFNIRSPSLWQGKMNYRVLLFSEVLVVTEPQDDKYKFLEALPIDQLKVLPTASSDTRAFVLEVKLGPEEGQYRRYGFRAPTVEAKDLWVEKINKLIRDYKDKVKREAGGRLY